MSKGPVSSARRPISTPVPPSSRTLRLRRAKLPATITHIILPPHGTDIETFSSKFLTGVKGPSLVIAADNLKACGVKLGDKELKGLDAFTPAAAFENESQVIIALDHHNPVPAEAQGKVGAELVLLYKDLLIESKEHALENGYNVVISSHNTPYDPDAMISQWLIKEITNGNIRKGAVADIYSRLAKYAKLTDFYQFVFTPRQHLTLRGICDGLAKLHGNNPQKLAEASDRILNWIKEKNLDPNDFHGFKNLLMELMKEKHKPGSTEALIQQCVLKKQEALKEAQKIYDKSKYFDLTLTDSAGKPVNTKIVLIDAKEATDYFKEIDDIAYSQDGTPVVIIKQAANGQWWVCMRPTNYNTETQAKSDPVLKAEQPPTFAFAPSTAGFHEQIVQKLPGDSWAIWPYNGTAEMPTNGEFGGFTAQEIADAILA